MEFIENFIHGQQLFQCISVVFRLDLLSVVDTCSLTSQSAFVDSMVSSDMMRCGLCFAPDAIAILIS